jgi:signal transduction histidine kinase
MPIRGRGDEVIGVIRCNNKSTEGPFGVGEFSTDDVETLGTVAGIVSHLHLTSSRLAAKEREREERMRNLYHEILSPVDHLLAHLVWASHRVISEMKTADLARLKAKVLDMFQIGQHIANVTTLMNQDNATRRLQVSQVAVHDVVQRTLGFFASEARRRNVRVTPLLERISAFPCDEDALMRVCYNLFRNGLKYVDDSEPAKYMKVQLSSDEEGGMHITVEDNGIGVPAGEEERIFDRFYRGTNAAAHAPTGEGLGLWYCRSLVVRMGGKIWLRRRSKPTEFCVVLRR